MNKKMSHGELKREILDFLNEHKSASLATCMNNIPRSSPVQYFIGNGMDIYILSAGGEKFDAIEGNNNVCLLVNTEYLTYKKIKGVQVFGKASTSISNEQLIDEAMKYCSDSYLLKYERDLVKVIKIVPDQIVYLDALGGDRTKQILRNDEVVVKEDSIPIL